MKILIAGGSGLIGKALQASLKRDGHTTLLLSRTGGEGRLVWNPAAGQIDKNALAGVDAVVNLAGSNIACRWTSGAKRTIRASRIDATTLLSHTLCALPAPPRVLVNASAIGYYGIAPEGVVTESSPPGNSFLADICKEWEAATAAAAQAGIRTVLLRIGVVLSPQDGALKKMLPAFKAGGGGALGDGRQWMSWIALEDIIGLIRLCLLNESLQGPLNAVAPEVVTNAQFTDALAKALGRTARLNIPAAMLRLLFGQMADETLLSSTRCSAAKAISAGYSFKHTDIESALPKILADQ